MLPTGTGSRKFSGAKSHKGPDAAQQGVKAGTRSGSGGIEFSTRKVVALECDIADKPHFGPAKQIVLDSGQNVPLPLVLPTWRLIANPRTVRVPHGTIR